MYVLIGIIVVCIGIVMLVSPKIFFEITESWKNSADAEPSGLYIVSTRIGGCTFIIVGLASIIVSFL